MAIIAFYLHGFNTRTSTLCRAFLFMSLRLYALQSRQEDKEKERADPRRKMLT